MDNVSFNVDLLMGECCRTVILHLSKSKNIFKKFKMSKLDFFIAP